MIKANVKPRKQFLEPFLTDCCYLRGERTCSRTTSTR